MSASTDIPLELYPPPRTLTIDFANPSATNRPPENGNPRLSDENLYEASDRGGGNENVRDGPGNTSIYEPSVHDTESTQSDSPRPPQRRGTHDTVSSQIKLVKFSREEIEDAGDPAKVSTILEKRLYIKYGIILERTWTVQDHGCKRMEKRLAPKIKFRFIRRPPEEEPVEEVAEGVAEEQFRFPYPRDWDEKRTDQPVPNGGVVRQNTQRNVTPSTTNEMERGQRGREQRSRGVGKWYSFLDVVGYEVKLRPTTNPNQQIYLVLGLFSSSRPGPREEIVFVTDPQRLFRKLRWGIFKLRGVWSSVFSLRSVQGFRLYECNVKDGTHTEVELYTRGKRDLHVLHTAYTEWLADRDIQNGWARWIHVHLNDKSYDVLKGNYSLEIVLGWSLARIAFDVIVIVLMSLGAGLGINAWQGWENGGAIQTAWGTASYVATAGALLAVLLGVLGNIGR